MSHSERVQRESRDHSLSSPLRGKADPPSPPASGGDDHGRDPLKVDCPRCPSGIGISCVDRAGAPRPPHQARIVAAAGAPAEQLVDELRPLLENAACVARWRHRRAGGPKPTGAVILGVADEIYHLGLAELAAAGRGVR